MGRRWGWASIQVECSAQRHDLWTGYVFTATEEILDSRPNNFQLPQCSLTNNMDRFSVTTRSAYSISVIADYFETKLHRRPGENVSIKKGTVQCNVQIYLGYRRKIESLGKRRRRDSTGQAWTEITQFAGRPIESHRWLITPAGFAGLPPSLKCLSSAPTAFLTPIRSVCWWPAPC